MINITNCDNVHIICDAKQGCDGAEINIVQEQSVAMEIKIECGTESSCDNMYISITGNAEMHTNISYIDYGAKSWS